MPSEINQTLPPISQCSRWSCSLHGLHDIYQCVKHKCWSHNQEIYKPCRNWPDGCEKLSWPEEHVNRLLKKGPDPKHAKGIQSKEPWSNEPVEGKWSKGMHKRSLADQMGLWLCAYRSLKIAWKEDEIVEVAHWDGEDKKSNKGKDYLDHN